VRDRHLRGACISQGNITAQCPLQRLPGETTACVAASRSVLQYGLDTTRRMKGVASSSALQPRRICGPLLAPASVHVVGWMPMRQRPLEPHHHPHFRVVEER